MKVRSWELLNVWDVPVVSWWLLVVDQSEQVCQQQPPAVGTAAAPDPATCLPASSHQLRPPVRQSSNSKWDLCDETEELFILPFSTFSNKSNVSSHIVFWNVASHYKVQVCSWVLWNENIWLDVEVLWRIVFVAMEYKILRRLWIVLKLDLYRYRKIREISDLY